MLQSRIEELKKKFQPKEQQGCKIYPIFRANVTYNLMSIKTRKKLGSDVSDLILTGKIFEGELSSVCSEVQRKKKISPKTKYVEVIDINPVSNHGWTVPSAFGEKPTNKSFKLFDYQEEMVQKGCKILKDHNIVIYALEMRLGKSHVSLETCTRMGYKSVLFITPKKAIDSVKEDFITGEHEFELEVINYESIHKVKNKNPDVFVFDEFHKIGSSFPTPSKKAKILREMCKDNQPIIYLSGTPTPESYSQIFHSLYISPSSPFKEYASFYKWANDYVKKYKIKVNGTNINRYDRADEKKVIPAYEHLIVSYTQKEAGFKFQVEDQIVEIEMKPSTYALAEVMEQDKLYEPKDGGVIMGDTPAKLMSKLHQIYSGTVIKEDDDGKSTPIFFDNSKIEYIRRNLMGKKIAIFYVFDEEGVQLRRAFSEHTEDCGEFQAGKSDIFISQVRKVKEGVRLDRADITVFYNLGFSATEYIQARQRLQSIDRDTQPVSLFLFAKRGIEAKIYKAVKSKKNFTARYY